MTIVLPGAQHAPRAGTSAYMIHDGSRKIIDDNALLASSWLRRSTPALVILTIISVSCNDTYWYNKSGICTALGAAWYTILQSATVVVVVQHHTAI